MKQHLIALAVVGTLVAQTHSQEVSVPKDQKDKVSYSLGLEIGSGMKQQKLDINPDFVIEGFRDGLAAKKPRLTEEERQKVMAEFEKSFADRMAAEAKVLPEKNKKEGDTFLAENIKKDGVKTLPSGLQYKVIKEGTGPIPKSEDKVTTHYRGTLIDGTEFDSSYSRNEPSSFGVQQVIKGWQEALQLMKVGSKWQLFVPSNLAYGENGSGKQIGPNATLIFDIELISIDKQ
ncbi:MAG: FKBP-type peptidyl-prolyl cis-trans isomerase [Verrucomicrobiota bacterium]